MLFETTDVKVRLGNDIIKYTVKIYSENIQRKYTAKIYSENIHIENY